MKNIKDFIEAKENVDKLKEVQKISPAPVNKRAPAKEVVEEYNLEDDKEPDEFNIGEGGLDDFLTSLKEERKSTAYATKAEVRQEPKAVRKTVGGLPKPPSSKPAVVNNTQKQAPVQAKPNKPPAPRPAPVQNNFDDIFADSSEPANPAPAPEPAPAPVFVPDPALAPRYSPPQVQPIAPQYKPAPAYQPQQQPQPANEYAKFASFYATYRQPTPIQPAAPNPNPANFQTRQQTPPSYQAESQYPRQNNPNDIWQ